MILITAEYSLDKDNNKVANQKPIFVISEHSKPAHGNIQPLFILWIRKLLENRIFKDCCI